MATDAVGAAVMGFDDPRAERGKPPFDRCENHLLLAEKAGVGTAGWAQLDVRGLEISQVRTRFNPPFRG